MYADSAQDTIRQRRATDVGVVMFRASMQLGYANDEARRYMARAERMDAVLSHKEDLRLAIVKFGVRVRDRNAIGIRALSNGVLATQMVNTRQGLFRFRALGVPDEDRHVGQRIMIVIEDCRKERSPAPRTAVPSAQ